MKKSELLQTWLDQPPIPKLHSFSYNESVYRENIVALKPISNDNEVYENNRVFPSKFFVQMFGAESRQNKFFLRSHPPRFLTKP